MAPNSDTASRMNRTLFPQITVVACFLHIYIGIRDRSKKKYKEVFNTVATKLWDCYKADSKYSFSQRVRRLSEWCSKTKVPDIILEKIGKLREKMPQLSKAYDFPGAQRTSNLKE